LILGSDGWLWGTMQEGGSGDGGTVWRMSLDGTFKVMHEFVATEGTRPDAPLLQMPGGSFYGTAMFGGAHGAGTVFRMTPQGKVSVVHAFGATPYDGMWPMGLLRNSKGVFYGVTQLGGRNGGQGTVYRLTPGGELRTLHVFGRDVSKGVQPFTDALVEGADGLLYGNCSMGGLFNDRDTLGKGTIFRIGQW